MSDPLKSNYHAPDVQQFQVADGQPQGQTHQMHVVASKSLLFPEDGVGTRSLNDWEEGKRGGCGCCVQSAPDVCGW